MNINLAKSEIIHFVGIGGIGMSGLASIMMGLGFKVQGSDRSINKNIERLKKIAIEASEQSNRINIPSIEQTQNLESFLNSNSVDLIFTDLNSTNKKIDKSKLTNKPICIIVGPEGDFSELEREKILTFKGVQTVKINENILRSETAVISAISIVNYVIN